MWGDIFHCSTYEGYWSVSFQFSRSVVSNSLRPHGLHAARQASLSITNSWSLLKLMSIESVVPSNRLILCWPLFLLPSIFASIRVFSNESVLHIRWPKDWSFSFSISPCNEYSGLISFGIDRYVWVLKKKTWFSSPKRGAFLKFVSSDTDFKDRRKIWSNLI